MLEDSPHSLPAPGALAASLAAGLVGGALTQLGQGHLPEALLPLANTGAPWVLIAFGVALLSRTAVVACLSGVLALAGLELGYVVMAAVQGYGSAWLTVAFWLTAAVVFGPFAGLAAYCLRRRTPPWDALGGGLVAGIVSGEGLASYLTVRDTTPDGYWLGQLVVGLVLAVVIVRRAGAAWTLAGYVIGVVALLATRWVPMYGS